MKCVEGAILVLVLVRLTGKTVFVERMYDNRCFGLQMNCMIMEHWKLNSWAGENYKTILVFKELLAQYSSV